MAKKTRTKKTCKKSSETQKTEQTFLRRLQQVVENKSLDKNRDLNDSDRVHARNISRQSSWKELAFSHANEDTTRDNFMCYRCHHFLEIPRNLSQPFDNEMSTFIGRCKEELSFVQAIVWLKSAIAYTSQIPIGQLQQIFNRQWNVHGERYCEDKRIDVKQSRFPVIKNSLVFGRTNVRDVAMSTFPDTSDRSYISPQRTILYARSENPQSQLSVSAKDSNESCIIPETDVESGLNEDLDTFDDMLEHQCFEFEKECSIQDASKSGIEQINKKIMENKHTLHTNVPSKYKFILSARNESINSMFDLENNFNEKCFTSMGSQNDIADKVPVSDGSQKSLTITQKDISQISNVNNDEYFEFLFDNSPCQVDDTAPGSSYKDSAYSTLHKDIFVFDTTVEARPITGNKRLSDAEPYYQLQPCKKKPTMYETGKSFSSTNGMIAFDGSPKSLIITQKDISQISDVYNDERSEFEIVNNYDERMSDIISENLKDNNVVLAESIRDKCTSNVEHYYNKQDSCNEKTTICEKMTTSAYTETVIPDGNIGYHYNLRNKEISREKEITCTIIEESKERKTRRAQNLLKNKNENEEMISADWLNFTLESLHVERVIIKSIRVILSTLCDKKTVEKYMIKEQLRNTRNYWKGSLEEEAVNAVLNISDIFTIEKKPNICIKVIMIAIVKALNEVMMRAQLNKIYFTETSVWIYRIQIILELCNSLPICIKVIDYLITKLESFQCVLINMRTIQKNTFVMINQLHFVFYALNITLRKYRTISSDKGSRSKEKIIPHVADLWKIHYIDKELEYTGLDLDAAEKRWLNALENSAAVFTKHFVQFAEKSFSLVHVLISQSSTKIT